jgi:hypothetical protein
MLVEMQRKILSTLTLQLSHQLHGEVLVPNIEHNIWPRLEDPLGHVVAIEQVHDLIGILHVVCIHQVERVPLPVHVGRARLRSTICVERLVHQVVDVEVERLLESFSCHVLSI